MPSSGGKKSAAQMLSERTLERLALEFEIGFFEAVLRHEPEHLGALEALGHAYTRAGLFEKGLAIDRRLVAMLPESAVAHYNLACSLSLLGQLDGAFAALARAIELGYDDFDYLANDPDLENLRRDRRYRALLQRTE